MEHEVYIEAGYMDEAVEVPPAVEEQIRRAVLAALEEEGVDVPCVIAVIVADPRRTGRTRGRIRCIWGI